LAIKYLTAAVELAPQFYAYLDGGLANSSNAKLDAATDLVALHHTLKAGSDLQSLSGLSESELEEMTDVLFSGKAGAYATGQLDAIQRYHTVLGMLYYETGQLTSGGANNATFQLDHALKTADRIAAEDPTKYQPLPELQVLLADVYRQREMVSDSARVSLDAAMGFLETDNLAAASQALRNAQQHGADQKRLASVTTVLTGRAAVKSRGSELLRTDQGTLSEMLGPEIAWLGNPDTLDLPQRFVDGQRFKALTDLGTQLTDAGKSDVARYVYGSALDAANNQKTLNSPADFRRLQNIESGITGSANRVKTPGQLTIDRGARVVPADDDQPGWSLPSTNRKVVLRIDAELLDKDNNVLKKNELPTAPKLDNYNE
jgi:hypothetical protein